jgi:arginyl-tRNA synthetase
MIKSKLKDAVKDALQALDIEARDVVLDRPADLSLGDYSTNAALIYAKNLKTSPQVLAERIISHLEGKLPSEVEKVEAISGFINFHLNKYFFQDSVKNIIENANFGMNDHNTAKKIMIEYTQPNPFKPFHIGHLMSNAIGESISRVLEYSGAKIFRANYQGDVGLHVAKAIWGLLKESRLQTVAGSHNTEAANIGQAYVMGAQAYEEDQNAKKEIDEINKKIYERSDEKINQIYDWGFKVTMAAFEDLYRILGTRFDYYFLESEMATRGTEIVRGNVGKVFEESDQAIVFKAEKYDPKLHTRVFITSQGLPTYEAKELGLTEDKFKTIPDMDKSIVVTAVEQKEYARVVSKAIAQIHPEYENKMMTITHGMMRFASGKMSSRKGNIITGESLLRDTHQTILEKMSDRDFADSEKQSIAMSVAVAAIKYSILKQASDADIIFDFEKAISFEGDSGPYLQYSFARANSILEKAKKENLTANFNNLPSQVHEVEKLLTRFPETVLRATLEFEPHYISNYLIELARAFNTYYDQNRIIDSNDITSPYKLALTEAFAKVLKTGLYLLGIEAPEKM